MNAGIRSNEIFVVKEIKSTADNSPLCFKKSVVRLLYPAIQI